jgi:hypothetical protein
MDAIEPKQKDVGGKNDGNYDNRSYLFAPHVSASKTSPTAGAST